MHPFRLSWAIVGACVFGLLPLAWALARPPEPGKVEDVTGKVVPLAEFAARTGARLDADAAPHSLVLQADDGKVWLLFKDGGSRMFYKDPALLNRPMRLTVRPLPGSQIVRVLAVRSLVKGQVNEVYYWCDICSIKRSEKNICECCGGPMKLCEEPLKK
jgi:hypothetical protein